MVRLKQKILVGGMTIAILLPLTSCTVNPLTNKTFESFESCMTANVVLATVGGVVIRQTAIGTGVSKSAANVTAVTGALLVTYTAWQKCAQAFQVTTYRDVVLRDAMPKTGPSAPPNSPTLQIDDLSIVATKWGAPLVTTARINLYTADRNKVDIPVVVRRILVTPPVPPDTERPTIPMLDTLIINQGTRLADSKIDTPSTLTGPDPKDLYQFVFEAEADGMKASKSIDFHFDGKKYSAAKTVPASPSLRAGTNDSSAERPGRDVPLPKTKPPVTKPKKNNTAM